MNRQYASFSLIYFDRWSSDQLKRLVAGQPVTVVTNASGGVFFTSSGKEVNREQVLSRAEWVYAYYNIDMELSGLLLEAQKQKR